MKHAGLAFEVVDAQGVRNLRRDVNEHRNVGRVHLEFRRPSGDISSDLHLAKAFLESLGLRPPSAWTKLTAAEAEQAAARVLHRDLAYQAPIMAIELAESLAQRFVECCGEGVVFFTNGALALTGTGAWSPITDATFDSGIVGLSSSRVGLLWVEDED
jgi:hypothetical protein